MESRPIRWSLAEPLSRRAAGVDTGDTASVAGGDRRSGNNKRPPATSCAGTIPQRMGRSRIRIEGSVDAAALRVVLERVGRCLTETGGSSHRRRQRPHAATSLPSPHGVPASICIAASIPASTSNLHRRHPRARAARIARLRKLTDAELLFGDAAALAIPARSNPAVCTGKNIQRYTRTSTANRDGVEP